jgi:hypothetical protein
MNGPPQGQIRLVIVGATGMVGGYALRYALDHPSVGVVTVISRRTLGISHPKLKEVLHRDFADCSALAQPSKTLRTFIGIGHGPFPTEALHEELIAALSALRKKRQNGYWVMRSVSPLPAARPVRRGTQVLCGGVARLEPVHGRGRSLLLIRAGVRQSSAR